MPPSSVFCEGNMIDHIIWDWNGTLLNDVDFGLYLANWLLRQYGKKELEGLHAYRSAFTFPIRDYYRFIGIGDDIFPQAAVKWMQKYMAEEHTCPLQPGALEVTRLFRERGLRQVIISASQMDNLKFQLTERPYFDFFDPPRALGDIYAGSKIDIAKDWMQHSGARGESTVFIGDTLHDLDAARAIGCRCVLVEGGHQLPETLRASGAIVAKSLPHAAEIILAMEA